MLINGRNIEDHNNKIKLREKVSFLSAQEKSFRGTILESLTLFCSEKIEEAIKLSDHFRLSELI
ncbi:hypothetical protein [Candidatus Coxiella mudrowiae]|uniref:hypothetical protein n=1 Tax=Candidatus Coxiella mudrowiae TaxID=2054173 RepID=UPI003CC827EA